MLDDLVLSDLDSKDNSFSTTNDFSNIDESAAKKLSAHNLELQHALSVKKPQV